jgi:hypothetical protein
MIKQKSWLWWLTIFANPNVSTGLYPHIYVSKNFYNLSKSSQDRVIKHEEIHLKQQQEYGLCKFLFFYIFCFPFFSNPWRYDWEYEAYTKSGTSVTKTKEYLSSWVYGWLKE